TGETPAPLRTGETPAPPRTGGRPAPLRTGETPAPLRTGETPAPLRTGETPAPLRTGETPAPLRTGGTPAPLAGMFSLEAATRYSVRPEDGTTDELPARGGLCRRVFRLMVPRLGRSLALPGYTILCQLSLGF